MHNDLITASMRRNEFDEILQYLHLADNFQITTDRYYKIRPLFREINQCFKIFLLPSDISTDETMIKYYGKHGT